MNKKAKVVETIITLIILLILLGVIYIYMLDPEGILPKAAEAGAQLADKELASLKREKVGRTILESDKNVEETYENILSILRTEGKGPCILKRNPLVSDFKGLRIALAGEGTDTSIRLINKDGQFIKNNKVSGKVPCVVGEGNSAQNFYNNYLKGKQCEANCPNDYSVASIELQSGNAIYVNGQKRDLNDGNLFFKTRDGNICFFPTHKTGVSITRPWEIYTKWGCDAGAGSLDDDCIKEISARIPECRKAEDEWPRILEDYEKNKCIVNKYTCKVENFPCKCFTSLEKQNKLKPDVCSMEKPYCYDGVEGCSDKGPDISYYFFVCRETNKNFEFAPKCSVDIDTCKVKNAPCTCYITKSVADQQSFPQLCLEGQYCYNEQKGCSTETSLLDCQKSNKN